MDFSGLTETDQRFYELLIQDIELPADSRNERGDLWDELLVAVDSKELTSVGVVQSFSEILSYYGATRWQWILPLMNNLCREIRESYPFCLDEILWPLIQARILPEADQIQDIIRDLSQFIRRDILRSYLSFSLMNAADTDRRRKIVFSFYYVGHDVESLKIFRQMIPLTEESAKIYT